MFPVEKNLAHLTDEKEQVGLRTHEKWKGPWKLRLWEWQMETTRVGEKYRDEHQNLAVTW